LEQLTETSPLELAVVLPTFCEATNVARMVEALKRSLEGIAWEAVFVDDHSPDGTATTLREIARTDQRIRVIERLGRRGLASACIEGMLAVSAPLIAVMDADLQHDPALLPRMLDRIRGSEFDIVIGSRFMAGGGTGSWNRHRLARSRLGARLSKIVLRAELTDPMSGFFMVRADVARRIVPKLSGIGFKILLDLFTAAEPSLRYAELPYQFALRGAGESKLDQVIALEFLIALYDRLFGRIIPTRFAMFAAIGGTGVIVHMGLLASLFAIGKLAFVPAHAVATLGAMTFNFYLNNAFTYRDQRLIGTKAVVRGWVSFCLICSAGAVANVGVAAFLFEVQSAYWTTSALAGIFVGAVWNYALSRHFTWGRY